LFVCAAFWLGDRVGNFGTAGLTPLSQED
jgi:hypothetical protein